MGDGQLSEGMGPAHQPIAITPEEARATLAALNPVARRWLAAVLGQLLGLHTVGLVVATADLAAVGLAVGRGEDGPPEALLDDVSGLDLGAYAPPGALRVLPNARLAALLYALVTGESQVYRR